MTEQVVNTTRVKVTLALPLKIKALIKIFRIFMFLYWCISLKVKDDFNRLYFVSRKQCF